MAANRQLTYLSASPPTYVPWLNSASFNYLFLCVKVRSDKIYVPEEQNLFELDLKF